MKKQAFNPYLSSYEYVPDGEPYVFGDRLYVYGSHDAFDGKGFCVNDYVCYYALVDELGDWRFKGVIYRRTQDPANPKGRQYMNAPDVCKGSDGRTYGLKKDAYNFELGVLQDDDGRVICIPDFHRTMEYFDF